MINIAVATKLTSVQRNRLEKINLERKRRLREERSRYFIPTDPSMITDFDIPANDQKGVLYDKADERWIFGGNRSGKTEFVVNDADMFARGVHPVRSEGHPTPVRIRICAPKWRDNVVQVLLRKFKQTVIRSELVGDSWDKAFLEKDHTLYYKNGSSIQFKSGEEDLDTFAGVDLDAVYHDEHIQKDRFDENMARLSDRDGFFVCSMTPELGVATWEGDYTDNPPKGVNLRYWEFSIYANPHMSKVGVEKFAAKITDKNKRDIKLYGRRVSLSGLVIPQFNREKTVIPDRNLRPGAYRVFCIDWHFKIPAAAVWAAWEPDERGDVKFIVYRILKMKGTVEKWKQRIRSLSAGEKIHHWAGDEPGGGDTPDFRGNVSALAEFRTGNDPLPILQVKKSAGSFNKSLMLMWDMFKCDPISGKPDIFIMESCLHDIMMVDGKYHGNIVWELERWSYKREKKADEESLRETVIDKDNHYISDIRYLAMLGHNVGSTGVVKSGIGESW